MNDEVMGELRRVGAERVRQRRARAQLREDTVRALRAARGLVPMEQAARVAGVARSTAYEILERKGDDDGHDSNGDG